MTLHVENDPSVLTLCCQPLMEAVIKSRTLSVSPYAFSFAKSNSWQTESNALLKSTGMTAPSKKGSRNIFALFRFAFMPFSWRFVRRESSCGSLKFRLVYRIQKYLHKACNFDIEELGTASGM